MCEEQKNLFASISHSSHKVIIYKSRIVLSLLEQHTIESVFQPIFQFSIFKAIYVFLTFMFHKIWKKNCPWTSALNSSIL